MKLIHKWSATIFVLLLAFVMASCQPGQSFNSTQSSASNLTPTQTQTPLIILSVTLTPTNTETPMPTLTPTPILTPTNTVTPMPTLTFTPIPTLPSGVKNLVNVFFNNSISYDNKDLVFTNHEVNGFSHWATHLQNIPDASRSPVYGLGLEFTAITDKIGSNIREKNRVNSKPPTYKWFFGDVPEEPVREVYMAEAYIESEGGVPFTPGFDASLSIDKTTFSEPGIQTVKLTIIPRVKMTFPGITVHTQGGPNEKSADASISGLIPGEQKGPKGEIISISPDKKDLFINDGLPLVVNQPYSFSFSIKVEPHGPNSTYSPYISISWLPKPESSSGDMENGIKQGNKVVYPIDKIGTWTWTANGDYQLEWHGGTVYVVNFGG